MNSFVFIITLIYVISNINPTLPIPMPPDQADIDLIVDSAYAAEKENKDFEQFLNELNTQPVSATIPSSIDDQKEPPQKMHASFEEYLKDLAAMEALAMQKEQAIVEQRVKEIFGIQDTTPLQNQTPSETSIKSCFALFTNNNGTIIEDFVNRIVEHMFSKPSESSVTKTRANWIKEIVNSILGELTDGKYTNEIITYKNTTKRTVPSGSIDQLIENSKKMKEIQKLQEEIFFTPFDKSPIMCTNQLNNKHTTPAPTIPQTPTDPCSEQCDIIVPYNRELLQLALAHARFDHRLLLTDYKMEPMSTMNSADLIIALINDILQLPQLTPLLLQSQRLDDHNILFEMSSASASLQIIAKTLAYQAHLADHPTFKVEATDANFFDIAANSRFGVKV